MEEKSIVACIRLIILAKKHTDSVGGLHSGNIGVKI
jgi:hypothetical protein